MTEIIRTENETDIAITWKDLTEDYSSLYDNDILLAQCSYGINRYLARTINIGLYGKNLQFYVECQLLKHTKI